MNKLRFCIVFFLSIPLVANDFTKAVESYNKEAYMQSFSDFYALATKDNKYAQHNIAMMYATGKGAKQDIVQAMGWYEKSAKQNYAPSMYNLAQLTTFANTSDISTVDKEC